MTYSFNIVVINNGVL